MTAVTDERNGKLWKIVPRRQDDRGTSRLRRTDASAEPIATVTAKAKAAVAHLEHVRLLRRGPETDREFHFRRARSETYTHGPGLSSKHDHRADEETQDAQRERAEAPEQTREQRIERRGR